MLGYIEIPCFSIYYKILSHFNISLCQLMNISASMLHKPFKFTHSRLHSFLKTVASSLFPILMKGTIICLFSKTTLLERPLILYLIHVLFYQCFPINMLWIHHGCGPKFQALSAGPVSCLGFQPLVFTINPIFIQVPNANLEVSLSYFIPSNDSWLVPSGE